MGIQNVHSISPFPCPIAIPFILKHQFSIHPCPSDKTKRLIPSPPSGSKCHLSQKSQKSVTQFPTCQIHNFLSFSILHGANFNQIVFPRNSANSNPPKRIRELANTQVFHNLSKINFNHRFTNFNPKNFIRLAHTKSSKIMTGHKPPKPRPSYFKIFSGIPSYPLPKFSKFHKFADFTVHQLGYHLKTFPKCEQAKNPVGAFQVLKSIPKCHAFQTSRRQTQKRSKSSNTEGHTKPDSDQII